MSLARSTIAGLSAQQVSLLKKGGIQTLSDLLCQSPKGVATKCRVTTKEVEDMIQCACEGASVPRVLGLNDMRRQDHGVISTGDATLDVALGGGVRTGMMWEVAGESAAGKTQFALQLSLFVQLQQELGGLAGSTCYLATSSTLPTSRLVQIAESHPLLRSSGVGLGHVHTISVPTISALLRVLSEVFPSFAKSQMQGVGARPVKLLIIDALAELFHTSQQTSTAVLVERSHNVAEISTLLHGLANSFQLAVLVLNEVVDAFNYGPSSLNDNSGLLIYNQQAQWFSRADSVPGENRKEVALGLVWSNQVNARILLSRTGRRRYIDEPDGATNKRPKLELGVSTSIPSHDLHAQDQSALVRRLTVIFSSVCRPTSLDYLVAEGGISIIPDEDPYPPQNRLTINAFKTTSKVPPSTQIAQMAALDVGSIEALCSQEVVDNLEGAEDVAPPEDEWDAYWKQNELADEIIGTLPD